MSVNIHSYKILWLWSLILQIKIKYKNYFKELDILHFEKNELKIYYGDIKGKYLQILQDIWRHIFQSWVQPIPANEYLLFQLLNVRQDWIWHLMASWKEVSEKYLHNLGHILDLSIQNYLIEATKHLLPLLKTYNYDIIFSNSVERKRKENKIISKQVIVEAAL